MLKNYIKSTFRNFRKYKGYSLIDFVGLSVGMAACLLILHYVNYERSYDKFYPDSERIYRLRYERTDESGDAVRFASCAPPAAARIRGKYPEVEKIGRMLNTMGSVSFNDVKFREEKIYYAEPQIFEILKTEFVKGNPVEVLAKPDNACISQSIAYKYFGDEDPIGKIISINKRADYQIAGVFADLPNNTHLKYDILLPWENLAARAGPDYTEAWGHTGSYTYLRVEPGTDPILFEKKLLDLVEAECPWLVDYKMSIDLKMQPLTDIHLTSHFMQEYEVNGDKDSVDLLFYIALFIIIIAWVNYTNLSTARALNRAKEVGLRKVVGASRGQLISQFFAEIAIINLIAIFGAILLIELYMPYFSELTGIPSDISVIGQNWFWGTIGIMFVAGVLFSGIYPVIALSSFKPIAVIKGKIGNSVSGINIRKVLVVFQFAVSLVLIIATITVYRQISFMRNQELGFDSEQVLVLQAPLVRENEYGPTFESFKQTLLQRVDITNISHVTEVPGRQIYWDAGGILKAGADADQGKNYQIVGIDYEFADLFDLEFAAGRNISRDFPSDTNGLIFNETAVKWIGFVNADSAVGQQVSYWGNIHIIIGVLKDYHQQSLKEEYEPHIYRYMPYGRGTMGAIAVKINSGDISQLIKEIKNEYDTFFPGNPFDYFFLDNYYNEQYKSEQLFGNIFSLFSTLAILITSLGIFGLSLYSASQRTKEIGIRKVMGASTSNILKMLITDSVKLIIIANLIAWPIAYYGISRWLEGFANRTDIGVWVFALSGLIIIATTILTISYQSYRSASANPVNSIQQE